MSGTWAASAGSACAPRGGRTGAAVGRASAGALRETGVPRFAAEAGVSRCADEAGVSP